MLWSGSLCVVNWPQVHIIYINLRKQINTYIHTYKRPLVEGGPLKAVISLIEEKSLIMPNELILMFQVVVWPLEILEYLL